MKTATIGLALAALLAATPGLAQDKLKFGQLRVPNALFVGIEKGHFRDQKIDLEVTFFRSGAEVASSLAAGHIDVGATTAGATLYNAMARGTNTKIVADYAVFEAVPGSNAIAVRKDLIDSGQVKTVADLKGKTIAITARGQFTHMFAGSMLQSAGLTEKDARLVTLAYPDMLAAFQGGSIDAAAFVEPFTTIATEKGFAVRFVEAAKLLPGMNFAVIMFGDRLLKEERELGVRFITAFHKANTDLRRLWGSADGRKELAAIYSKHLPVPDPSLYERAAPTAGRVDLVPDVDGKNGLRAQMNWYVEAGLVPTTPDLNQYVDPEFAQKAKAAAR